MWSQTKRGKPGTGAKDQSPRRKGEGQTRPERPQAAKKPPAAHWHGKRASQATRGKRAMGGREGVFFLCATMPGAANSQEQIANGQKQREGALTRRPSSETPAAC